MTEAWYSKDDEGRKKFEEIEARKKVEQEGRKKQWEYKRFWLKEGNSADITFVGLDKIKPFPVWEHQIYLNGHWYNWFTCRNEIDECPLCEAGYKAYFAMYFTIIDHTPNEFTTKKGEHVNEQHIKKLFPAKSTVFKRLCRKAEEYGGLNLRHFSIARDTKEEANTGTDLSHKKLLTPDDLFKLMPDKYTKENYLAPFNYDEVFKPLPIAQLRKIVGTSNVLGSADDDDNSSSLTTGDLNDQL